MPDGRNFVMGGIVAPLDGATVNYIGLKVHWQRQNLPNLLQIEPNNAKAHRTTDPL
jgi:hypothetical protein